MRREKYLQYALMLRNPDFTVSSLLAIFFPMALTMTVLGAKVLYRLNT